MTPDQKAWTARILGYICVVVGVLNLAIVGTRAFRVGMGGSSARAPVMRNSRSAVSRRTDNECENTQ